LQVQAIHDVVGPTRYMTRAVQEELDDLAAWLGLSRVERS
jgi:hypothetical protein